MGVCAAYSYAQLVMGVSSFGLLFLRAAITVALGAECYVLLERYKSGAITSFEEARPKHD
jgi:hypothetical protein